MINFLYTNIGRGHPFYLDGILEILKQQNRLKFKVFDVFEISKDPALSAWRMARWLYKVGSTDSVIGKWYNSIREKADHNQNSFAMRVMGNDLRKLFSEDETPLVVDHPVLIGMLNGKKNLLYQHGEIAVPKQAVVRGADTVFVPTEESAMPFLNSGYDKGKIVVTGLCIEPLLVRQSAQAFENRIRRFDGTESLTGAFFSSGAEPMPHVEKLVEAAISAVKVCGSAIVFAQANGRLSKNLSRVTAGRGGAIELCSFESREELDRVTVEHFERFDYLVSPSHERTNWALGLGLPMFILDPAIGPFSPLNRASLMTSGAADAINSIDDASKLGARLAELRKTGKLTLMANSGWVKRQITGFKTIAEFLINKFAPNS